MFGHDKILFQAANNALKAIDATPRKGLYQRDANRLNDAAKKLKDAIEGKNLPEEFEEDITVVATNQPGERFVTAHSISRRLRRIEDFLGVPKPPHPFMEGMPSLDGASWRKAEQVALSEKAYYSRGLMDLRKHILKIEEFIDNFNAK